MDAQQADELLDLNIEAIKVKLAKGKTLSIREQNLLQSISDGGAASSATYASNQTEAARALGIDRKTFARYSKLPGAPEPEADGRINVPAFRSFIVSIGKIPTDSIAAKKERHLDLKNEKLAAETEILKRNWIPKADVEKLGSELGLQIRKVISTLHIVAPQVVGVSVPEAEKILKEKEDEVLRQLNLIPDTLDNFAPPQPQPENAPAA